VRQAFLFRAWYRGGGCGGAAIPVDWAAATATDGREAYSHPLSDAEKAAAAAPVPASSSTEAPVAWPSPASVEAGMAAAPATGATTMLPPAGATCGGGASDAAPSSPVTTCRSSLLCGTAQRAARWSVAGEVAAAAVAISAYLAAAAADGDRVAALAGGGGGATAWHTYAASLHSATAALRTTGPGALCRWPSGAGGGGADATSLPPATNDGAAPPGTAPHNAAW